jgi:iron complex outermembrane recepter protein
MTSDRRWLPSQIEFWVLLVLIPFSSASALAQSEPAGPTGGAAGQAGGGKSGDEIFGMELQQLSSVDIRASSSAALEMPVTSVSRTPEPMGRTPAAIYVVTNEMIRRCGARNIPEVLRTVPGVDVARVNASTWAISIRGFNGRFANKLLVQVDNVPIYTPLNSGVFWEREPVMLEDIERIEVIRGPGGTLWGNNAVNGIINIITKSSKDTKGAYADVGGGNTHRQFADARYGGQTGNLTYRVWGTNIDENCGIVPDIAFKPVDFTHNEETGFRTDWALTRQDTFTIQGDLVQGVSDGAGYVATSATPTPTDFRKTLFLTQWRHVTDEDTDWTALIDYYNPYGNSSAILENTTNVHFDFQYHLKRNAHDVVWGFGYRNEEEKIAIPALVTFSDSEQIPSYFVQDTITLVDDRLFATFGSKFDNNTVTNFEYQPSAKVAYTPNERTSCWAAITRAVRTPSLFDRALAALAPNNSLASETELSYEIGYRRQATDALFWELATFFNRYDNLLADNLSIRRNVGHGDTYGFEYNANYRVSETWRLTGSFSFFVESLEYPPGYTADYADGTAPRNQFYLQSGWDLGRDVTLDIMFRYVDSLAMGVESYYVGDVRLAWRPTRRLELAVVGQSLFGGCHYEYGLAPGAFDKPTEVQPGVYGMVSWRY